MRIYNQISNKILSETNKLYAQIKKNDSDFQKIQLLPKNTLPLSSGNSTKFDFIAINNSFILRSNKLKTNKSRKYLGVISSPPKGIRDLIISFELDLKSDWSFVSSKNKQYPLIADFSTELGNEVSQLGRLIYILIGETGELPKVSCDFNNKFFNSLNLDSAINVIEVNNDSIYFNPTYDDTFLWSELKNVLNFPPNEIANIEKEFFICLKKIRSEVKMPLYLPNQSSSLENTFLDNISNSIYEEVSKYEKSLRIWQENKKDEANFNEILRISVTTQGNESNIQKNQDKGI